MRAETRGRGEEDEAIDQLIKRGGELVPVPRPHLTARKGQKQSRADGMPYAGNGQPGMLDCIERKNQAARPKNDLGVSGVGRRKVFIVWCHYCAAGRSEIGKQRKMALRIATGAHREENDPHGLLGIEDCDVKEVQTVCQHPSARLVHGVSLPAPQVPRSFGRGEPSRTLLDIM